VSEEWALLVVDGQLTETRGGGVDGQEKLEEEKEKEKMDGWMRQTRYIDIHSLTQAAGSPAVCGSL